MENTITGLKAQIESLKVCHINQETGEFDQKGFEAEKEKLLLEKAWEIKLIKDQIESRSLREKVLREERQALETKMENDRKELESFLEVGQKIKGKYCTITLTEKESPVYDEDVIIATGKANYLKMAPKINKSAILEDAKKGVEIPGFTWQNKAILYIK